jgi:hypothetical protein
MNRKHVALASLLVLLASAACSKSESVKSTMEDSSSAQDRLNELALLLINGEVRRIEILHTPTNILTRTRLTPDIFEQQYYYKLTIQHASGFRSKNDLVTAIRTTSATPTATPGDVRWGVIFYSAAGERLGAIYLDGSGKLGYVNEVSVSLSKELFRWLDSTLPACFR